MTETQTWSKRVRALRSAMGLPRSKMARELGCSPEAIEQWETTPERVPMEHFRKAIERLEREQARREGQ